MTTVPEPTVSQFDLADQKERHRVAEREYQAQLALQNQRDERRKLRIRWTGNVLVALVGTTGALVGFHLWWLAVRGPSAADLIHQQEMTACIDKGGTWIELGDQKDKTCVFMKDVTKP